MPPLGRGARPCPQLEGPRAAPTAGLAPSSGVFGGAVPFAPGPRCSAPSAPAPPRRRPPAAAAAPGREVPEAAGAGPAAAGAEAEAKAERERRRQAAGGGPAMVGLKEELLKSIWHAFTALDLDRSGKVSKSQLKARRGARGARGAGVGPRGPGQPHGEAGSSPVLPLLRLQPPVLGALWPKAAVGQPQGPVCRGWLRAREMLSLARGERGPTVRSYSSVNRRISQEAPTVPFFSGSRSEVMFVLLKELSGSSLNPIPSWPCFMGPAWPGHNSQHPTK